MNKSEKYYSGFAAVVGRPNVGKSTLTNQLIGQKIAIMSDKPQTTRNRIMCVLTTDEFQVVFIDTPGIHKPKHKLGEYMVDTALTTLKEVDLILFVVDASEEFGAGDRFILERLKTLSTPVVLLVNKIDKIAPEKLLPLLDQLSKFHDFKAIVPVSALKQMNLDRLLECLKQELPEGPQYYPEDMVTDQPERLIMAELIREKVLHQTRDEVPHAIAVETEEVKTRNNGDLYVRAVIYVERESQKGIIIGAKGALLKEIGRQARQDIEVLLGSKCYLELWVKVKKDWRNQAGSLHALGYVKEKN